MMGWGYTKPPQGWPLNRTHALAQGLKGAYLFQGELGKDYSQSGNGLSNASGLVVSAPGRFGGRAAQFSHAAKSFLSTQIVNMNMPLTAPLTLVCWAKAPAWAVQVAMSITNYSGGGSGNYFELYLNSDGTVHVQAYATGVNADAGSSVTVAANQWFQMAGVFVSSSLRYVYVNGQNVGTNTTSCVPLSLNQAFVGNVERSDHPNLYWEGHIDHAYFYARALSDVEMLQLYREPFAMFVPPRRDPWRGAPATLTQGRSFVVLVG